MSNMKGRWTVARKDMKSALGASMKAEEQTVRDRFARAEEILGNQDANPSAPQASPPQPSRDTRVIRDSFTMPFHDYDLIAHLRERCLKAGVSITKSEAL